jgi:hypothetical protein
MARVLIAAMKALPRPTTFLSIAAGFAGGFVSQAFFSPQPAWAQLEIPPPMRPHKRPAATEVDAQRFVLVDSFGNVKGEIKMHDEQPEIVLYDKEGKPAWRATTNQRGFQLLDGGH